MTGDAPTVLIVEDEPALTALYEQYLSGRYRVKTARSGEEALDLLDETVDVLLLDRNMPGLTGDAVLREVARRGFDGRVAMVTAMAPQSDIVDFGIEDYLVKPVGRDELLQAVAQLVAIGRHEDRVQEFVELSMKQAALETEHDPAELADSAQYQRLNDRVGELSQSLGDLSGILSESELELFLDGLVRRLTEHGRR
jgi:DNA-binding response OmpR family regulator